WSEYPPRSAERGILRLIADWEEHYDRSIPRQASDRLLDFDGDFQIPPGLSQRDREILVMTAYGYSCQRIADALGLALNTIHTYKNRLGRKLDCAIDFYNARNRLRLPYRDRSRRRRVPRSRQ